MLNTPIQNVYRLVVFNIFFTKKVWSVGLPLCIHHGCHMGKQYGKGKCDVVSHRARLEFLVGLPSLLQNRIHKQIHFKDPGANPLPSCPFSHAGRWVASKMICIQIYRTGTRMGESKKLATGKDPPDQASAVKCSTPKPRRQKKTGTAPFVLGPLIRNARIILQSTPSARCCPPYWHISRTGGPRGGATLNLP
jgi:hypothetical protein